MEVLREKYIVRADVRAGGTWYELAHDRLVKPIVADNQKWRDRYRNPIEDALRRGPDNFLTGRGLKDALRYREENPRELNPEEKLFLERSVAEEKNTKGRRRNLAIAGLVVIVGLAGLAAWALVERHNANTASVEARDQRDRAVATLALEATKNGDSMAGMLATLAVLLGCP